MHPRPRSTRGLLRQTSLDVRGEIPTFDELERVRLAEDREAEVARIIEEMFDGEAYRRTLREYHAGLLWATVDEDILPRLPSPQARILPFGGSQICALQASAGSTAETARSTASTKSSPRMPTMPAAGRCP